jgi:hypothetical protein
MEEELRKDGRRVEKRLGHVFYRGREIARELVVWADNSCEETIGRCTHNE